MLASLAARMAARVVEENPVAENQPFADSSSGTGKEATAEQDHEAVDADTVTTQQSEREAQNTGEPRNPRL